MIEKTKYSRNFFFFKQSKELNTKVNNLSGYICMEVLNEKIRLFGNIKGMETSCDYSLYYIKISKTTNIIEIVQKIISKDSFNDRAEFDFSMSNEKENNSQINFLEFSKTDSNNFIALVKTDGLNNLSVPLFTGNIMDLDEKLIIQIKNSILNSGKQKITQMNKTDEKAIKNTYERISENNSDKEYKNVNEIKVNASTDLKKDDKKHLNNKSIQPELFEINKAAKDNTKEYVNEEINEDVQKEKYFVEERKVEKAKQALLDKIGIKEETKIVENVNNKKYSRFIEEANLYYQTCNPYGVNNVNYNWWAVNNIVNFGNHLVKHGIKIPIIFSPAALKAFNKYRHMIMGTYTDKSFNKNYFIIGIPGSGRELSPYGELCKWVEINNLQNNNVLRGYWLMYMDVDKETFLKIN